MKKTLLTLALVAACGATVFGQGRIGFDNLSGGGPVTVDVQNQGPSGGAAGAFVGGDYLIQLVWAPQGVYGSQAAFDAAALGSSTPVAFFGATGGSPGTDGAGLFDASGEYAPAGTIPLAVGSYTVQARAWYATGYATFAAALGNVNSGYSAFGDISSVAAPTPANYFNPQPFTVGVVVPEPGTLALAGLGAASLLLFRRKK